VDWRSGRALSGRALSGRTLSGVRGARRKDREKRSLRLQWLVRGTHLAAASKAAAGGLDDHHDVELSGEQPVLDVAGRMVDSVAVRHRGSIESNGAGQGMDRNLAARRSNMAMAELQREWVRDADQSRVAASRECMVGFMLGRGSEVCRTTARGHLRLGCPPAAAHSLL